jgi:CubicO group peptidase (beta-lactamase class C family)
MLTVLSTFVVLLVRTVYAQIPETAAGRVASAWLDAMNSSDRAKMQSFLDAYMPGRNVEQSLAMRDQFGGLDLKRVESSNDTSIVLLLQERGGLKEFDRLSVNVEPAEPHKITGIRVQRTQPPADLAPPKMTAAEQEAAHAGAPFRQFSAWLDAFNSGDSDRFRQFLKENFPSRNPDGDVNFRSRVNGFDLRAIEKASATAVSGLVQERDGDQFARFSVEIDPAEPHHILRMSILAIPRPPEFPMPPSTEADLVSALRTRLEKDTAADRFAGTVLFAKNGKVLFSGAYGMADREKKVANTMDTRFRIGSMNKMFTAVSMMQLVQAGKVKLTDPLGKYITDYPNQDVATKVTIHQLLTHTGGTGDFFGPEFDAHRLELKTLNDYITLFGKRAPGFEPGSRYAYSNYGMLLAGVVIERVSGQSYYDYVVEHVYKPAGMSRTASEPEDTAVAGRSIGYMHPQGAATWKPNTDTLPYRGTSAGGGYSTVGDLVKFAEALMSHKLLNAENTDLLLKGKVEVGPGRMYAYGFEDARKEGEGSVGHSGGAPGMNGDLRIFPKSGYVIAVLSNLDPPAASQESTFIETRIAAIR